MCREPPLEVLSVKHHILITRLLKEEEITWPTVGSPKTLCISMTKRNSEMKVGGA